VLADVSRAQQQTPRAPTGDEAELWHTLLLRMAGVVPDDLVSRARGWIAAERWSDAARALAFVASVNQVPLTVAELDVVSRQLRAAGLDLTGLANLENQEREQAFTRWAFTPVRIEAGDDLSQVPLVLDLSTGPQTLRGLDAIDHAAVVAVRSEPEFEALWRAWRKPLDGSSWPTPRRVFIATMADTAPYNQAASLAARIQDALSAAGERSPQVEVCHENRPVPGYQRAARAQAALLWTREPVVTVQLATVFDLVDPQNGPSFSPDRARIEDEDEMHGLLTYLDAGQPVLATTARMVDVVGSDVVEAAHPNAGRGTGGLADRGLAHPARPSAVPLTFRTDGTWIWTDAVGYYLKQHSLAPQPALLEHVRQQLREVGPVPAPVSTVALHRVLSFLQRPDDTEMVWVVPETSQPGGPSWGSDPDGTVSSVGTV
jgi:hypothetical protein